MRVNFWSIDNTGQMSSWGRSAYHLQSESPLAQNRCFYAPQKTLRKNTLQVFVLLFKSFFMFFFFFKYCVLQSYPANACVVWFLYNLCRLWLFLPLGLLKHRNTHFYRLCFYIQPHQRNPRPLGVMTQGVATWKTWRRWVCGANLIVWYFHR